MHFAEIKNKKIVQINVYLCSSKAPWKKNQYNTMFRLKKIYIGLIYGLVAEIHKYHLLQDNNVSPMYNDSNVKLVIIVNL